MKIFTQFRSMVLPMCMAALVAFGMAACNKDDDDNTPPVTNPPTDTTKVDKPLEITISSPPEDYIYNNGDTLFVKALIKDGDEAIHEYGVQVYNAYTEKNVIDLHKHVHVDSIVVDTFWVINVTHHTNILVKVRAKNHSGDSLEVERRTHSHD